MCWLLLFLHWCMKFLMNKTILQHHQTPAKQSNSHGKLMENLLQIIMKLQNTIHLL